MSSNMSFQAFTIIVVLAFPLFTQFSQSAQGARVGETCLKDISDGLTVEQCKILVAYLCKETGINFTTVSDNPEDNLHCIHSLVKLNGDGVRKNQNGTRELLEAGLVSINKTELTSCLKKEFADFTSDENDSDEVEDYAALSWFQEDNFFFEGLMFFTLFLVAFMVIIWRIYKASKELTVPTSPNAPLGTSCSYSQVWDKFSGSEFEISSDDEEKATEGRKPVCPASYKHK